MFGLIAAGGGTLATFVTTNQAGSTALLLGGALGLLMSLTGRVPDKIGKEGVVHDPVDSPESSVIRTALTNDYTEPSVKAEIAQLYQAEVERRDSDSNSSNELQMTIPATPSGRELRSLARSVLYEQAVTEGVRNALPEGWELIEQPRVKLPVGGNLRFDGAIRKRRNVASDRLGRDRLIPLEERHKTIILDIHNGFVPAESLAAQTSTTLQSHGFGAVLVVAPRESGLKALDNEKVKVVGYLFYGAEPNRGMPTDDFQRLQKAIGVLIDLVSPPVT